MKTPEEIMKEMHWTYDADPGRYSLFISLIKPAMEKYAEQFKILNKHEVIGSVCRCKRCGCEIKNDVGDGLCAECWSAN
jgi:hypothetical protein